MSASIWLLSAVLVLSGPDDRESGRHTTNRYQLDNTLVTLIDEIDIAAQEAGIITDLTVQEGSEVRANDKIAQISDSKAQAAKKVAQAEHEVALAEAENDISVRYAKKAAEVAYYDFMAHKLANKQAKGSTPEAEMKKLHLSWQKGELETEKAQLELDVAKLTAKAKEASVEAADDDIHRRRVFSPIDAVVIEIDKHVGEWVNPGDRIARIVRMNKVRVKGMLALAEVSPIQVADRPITVEARISNNRSVQFQGRIVFVAPELDPSGKYYKVVAEVENREENGTWLLLKGMSPRVTVEAGIAADETKTRR
ncbi:MAG TPA: HlyD family efflux transporter periplasmic adaptor subunit [Pirellulales bacterium]|nr:HlyD family efflux transporter periplasmic adaptor subunit [Pirellulales bacterium]